MGSCKNTTTKPLHKKVKTKLRKCEKSSLFISAKPVSKWVMLVGSFTALNVVSSQMVKCLLIRPLEAVMTLSTPFSLKLVLENTSQGLCLLILNQLSSMKFELELIDNCSTLNN